MIRSFVAHGGRARSSDSLSLFVQTAILHFSRSWSRYQGGFMDFLLSVLSPSNILLFLQLTGFWSYLLALLAVAAGTGFAHLLAGSWVHEEYQLTQRYGHLNTYGLGVVLSGAALALYGVIAMLSVSVVSWPFWVLMPMALLLLSRYHPRGKLYSYASKYNFEKKWQDAQVRVRMERYLVQIDLPDNDRWKDVNERLENVRYQLERLLYARRSFAGAMDALEEELDPIEDEKRRNRMLREQQRIDERYSKAVKLVRRFLHFIDDIEHRLRAGLLGADDLDSVRSDFHRGYMSIVEAVDGLMTADMEEEFEAEWQALHADVKLLPEHLPDDVAPDSAHEAALAEVNGVNGDLEEALQRIRAKAAKRGQGVK